MDGCSTLPGQCGATRHSRARGCWCLMGSALLRLSNSKDTLLEVRKSGDHFALQCENRASSPCISKKHDVGGGRKDLTESESTLCMDESATDILRARYTRQPGAGSAWTKWELINARCLLFLSPKIRLAFFLAGDDLKLFRTQRPDLQRVGSDMKGDSTLVSDLVNARIPS
jgi:hypothetical protein